MKTRYYILVAVFIACLGGSLAMAVNRGWLHESAKAAENVAPAPDAPVKYSPEEMEVINGLLKVYGKIDTMKTFYAAGHVSMLEPADSTQNLNTSFVYARQGDSVYYQMGETRTLSLPGIYISVNDAVKKIFVASSQEAPPAPFKMPQEQLLKIIGKEGYHVQGTMGVGENTCRLYLDNHVFCKEYRLTYNEKFEIRQVYARFTNLEDPLNTKMDRVMNMKIPSWQSGSVPPGILDTNTFITQHNDGFVPAEAFRSYEVILN